MQKYYFSGSLTNEMHDLLAANKYFEPIDMLVSQLDRSTAKKLIEWKKDGFCKSIFIDSGAFSVHTGKAKTTVDEYIDYLNSIDEYIDVFAQLDTIPGKLGQPKTTQDYIESAEKSWDNYLYMRERVKSPDKLMPVFHFGESPDVLRKMLSWRDENGHLLKYIGLSPANDAPMNLKDQYLKDMNSVIATSENPDVKTHLYGYTSLKGLSNIACYSCDSISHRLQSGYCKIISYNFGVISITKQARTNRAKSNSSFMDLSDEHNMQVLEEELADIGFTLEQAQESVSIRVVINMINILRILKNAEVSKVTVHSVPKTKKLFSI